MVHELKTHPEPFDAIRDGYKTFEFRLNDRNFQMHDEVVLREWLPNLRTFSGDLIKARVGYVLKGPAYGVPEGYCCFSLLDVKRTRGLKS